MFKTIVKYCALFCALGSSCLPAFSDNPDYMNLDDNEYSCVACTVPRLNPITAREASEIERNARQHERVTRHEQADREAESKLNRPRRLPWENDE